jgi:hypothetical protein
MLHDVVHRQIRYSRYFRNYTERFARRRQLHTDAMLDALRRGVPNDNDITKVKLIRDCTLRFYVSQQSFVTEFDTRRACDTLGDSRYGDNFAPTRRHNLRRVAAPDGTQLTETAKDGLSRDHTLRFYGSR